MEGEFRNEVGDDRHYPALFDLDWRLQRAIEQGDVDGIIEAVKDQIPTDVTEDISNALKVRAFLLDQAQELVKLDCEISNTQTVDDIVSAVWLSSRRSEKLFTESFFAQEASDAYAKLSGDDLFREKLSQRDESMPAIARSMVSVDISSFSDASHIYKEMQTISDYIVYGLWSRAEALRVTGMYGDTIGDFHELIASCVDMVNARIEEDFPE